MKRKDTRYSEIQKIKQKLSGDSINFGKVMALDLYNEKSIYFIKIIKDALIYEYNFILKDNKASHLLFSNISKNRRDYIEIFDKYKAIVENYDEVSLEKKFVFKSIVVNMYRFFLEMYNSKNLENIKFFDKLRLSLLMVKYKNMQRSFKGMININSYDLCTTFCDAHSADNLVAQICNSANIKTITLQHGQYRGLKQGLETPDSEAYDNFVSDYLLCWGQATVDEFVSKGVCEERLIKVGALKEYSNSKKNISLFENENVFGVILNGETYRESNLKMLKIANELSETLNMDYVVRLHPKNKSNFYKKVVKKNTKFIKDINGKSYSNLVSFSLIHMSGVYLELLSGSEPFFILDDRYTEQLFLFPEGSFRNSNELIEKYNYYLSNPVEYQDILSAKFDYFNFPGTKKSNYINALSYIGRKDE